MVGDLVVTLTHIETGTTTTLIDRPGRPATTDGCGRDDISCTLDDETAYPVEDQCAPSSAGSPTIEGGFRPHAPLSIFDGQSPAGQWRLNVCDNALADTGSLVGWCLEVNSPAPVVTEFTCNGVAECVVPLQEPFALFFSYMDPNGDANGWRITARRDDGFAFDVLADVIDPPSASGMVPIDFFGFTCEGVCRETQYDYTVVVTDSSERESTPARVHLVVLGSTF